VLGRLIALLEPYFQRLRGYRIVGDFTGSFLLCGHGGAIPALGYILVRRFGLAGRSPARDFARELTRALTNKPLLDGAIIFVRTQQRPNWKGLRSSNFRTALSLTHTGRSCSGEPSFWVIPIAIHGRVSRSAGIAWSWLI